MNEARTDVELLQAFARRGDQPAFAAVVRRYVDLVYATALRKVGDAGAAEEITQNVFAALARKAWQFAADDSLPAWLHRAALLESKAWLRGELRRRRREEVAAELSTTMNRSEDSTVLSELLPLLDDALMSLREKDRSVLLLRFHEGRSLREVGAVLGVGEDAAQKRVAGALDQVTRFFQRRGFRTATVAATTEALWHTAASAPATLAATIANLAAGAAPPALAGLTAFLAHLASLTRAQTVAICLVTATVPVAWQWPRTRAADRQATEFHARLQADRAQASDLRAEVKRLQTAADRLDFDHARLTLALAPQKRATERLDELRQRLQALLAARDYRWPDDLPFVRIPKAALTNLNCTDAIRRTGEFEAWGAEVLGMTAEERLKTQQSFSDFLRSMTQLAASRAYETSPPPQVMKGAFRNKQAKAIAVPPLGEDARVLAAGLRDQVQQTLGSERQRLLLHRWDAEKSGWSWLGACRQMADEPQVFTVWIAQKPGGIWHGEEWTNAKGTGGAGGGADRESNLHFRFLPDSLRSRFFDPWLGQLGLTNGVPVMNP
jgi:RNA polymerase sigma factor (sigma-70 family)